MDPSIPTATFRAPTFGYRIEVSWVRRIMTRYATCASYTDRGTVYLRSEVLGRFETSFLREGERLRFTFEWVRPPQRCVLVARGAVCRATGPSWWTDSSNETRIGVAALTGATFTAAHFAPRHLIPDHVEGRALDAAAVIAAGEETVMLRDRSTLILIDRETLTARRFGVTNAPPTTRTLQAFAMSAHCTEHFSTLVTYDAVEIVPAS